VVAYRRLRFLPTLNTSVPRVGGEEESPHHQEEFPRHQVEFHHHRIFDRRAHQGEGSHFRSQSDKDR
jgi:hypothetical protein